MTAEATACVPHRTTIEVGASPELLYSLWCQFDRAPLFFHHVRGVELDPDNCHVQRWSGELFGCERQWTVYITEREAGQRLAWRSMDEHFENSGAVSFAPGKTPETTLVTIEMFYEPPAGSDPAVAAAWKENFAAALGQDLGRVKPVAEALDLQLDSRIARGEPLDQALAGLFAFEAGALLVQATQANTATAAAFEQAGVFLSGGADTVSATELFAMLQGGNPLILIDVRFNTDFENGHIEGAMNSGLDTLELRVFELFERLETIADYPIVLYSNQDGISARGVTLLKTAGYASVLDYPGGYSEWEAMGLPVTRPEEEEDSSPEPEPAGSFTGSGLVSAGALGAAAVVAASNALWSQPAAEIEVTADLDEAGAELPPVEPVEPVQSVQSEEPETPNYGEYDEA